MRFLSLVIFLLIISNSGYSKVKFATFPEVEVKPEFSAKWQNFYLTNQANIEQLLGEQLKLKTDSIYVNSLIESSSPYLIRHAFNPILWNEWSAEAFAKAEQQNKLVFLSIGYSSCHWCHVMEHESFVDEQVAEALNRSYISIKVDKELSPAIDNRYTTALELAKGSSGWPISAILNADGDVIYIDSYIDKQKFIKLLNRMAKSWQKNKAFFAQSAKLLMNEVDKLNALSLSGTALKKNDMEQIFASYSSKFDQDVGGLAGPVKFPEPALMMTLLDQYQRAPEPTLAAFIEKTLTHLAENNLNDQVYGGFFRYTTDGRYRVPHFEKMLYTQAYMISVYSKAYSIFKKDSYRLVAEQTYQFVTQWLQSDNSLYFSAIDADLNGVEGGYYLWTLEQKEGWLKKQNSSINWSEMDGMYLPSFPLNEKQKKSLHVANNTAYKKSRPFIDKKIIVSWNALLANSLLDLFVATGDADYFTQAKLMANQLWELAWDSKQKLLFRSILGDNKSGHSKEDAIELALLMTNIHLLTEQPVWLEKAKNLYQSLEKSFLSTKADDKLYQVASLEKIIANDGEGFSELSRFFLLANNLNAASKDSALRHKVKQIKKALEERLSKNALARLYSYYALKQTMDNSLSDRQYFAQGKGFVILNKVDKGSYQIQLKLDKGWHINSNKPTRKELIPTKLAISINDKPITSEKSYPEAYKKKLAFTKQSLELFEGNIALEITTKKALEANGLLELTLQACSDNICQLPEKILFSVD